MDIEGIRQEAQELEVGFYENRGIIDLDGENGLGGTFAGKNAEQEARQWLDMYRVAKNDNER